MSNPFTIDYELIVIGFFKLGTLTGFASIIESVARQRSPLELTPNITAAFLMSISGNCTRSLAKPDAFITEKLAISIAVLTYSAALYCDCDDYPVVAVNLKLITTGCVGLWNAIHVFRIHPEMTRPMFTQTPKSKAAIAAFISYSVGAAMGFSAMSIGLLSGSPSNELAPFITFTFLMSHLGNLARSELNVDAQLLEKCYIRAAVFFYCIALCCDFLNEPKANDIAVYSKLTAAGFVGLWNAAHTWRLNPTVYHGTCIPARDSVTRPRFNISNDNMTFFMPNQARNYLTVQTDQNLIEMGELPTTNKDSLHPESDQPQYYQYYSHSGRVEQV